MNYENNSKLVSLEVLAANFLNIFRSKNTRDAYKADLSQFFIFCKTNLNVDSIKITQITETLCFAWRHSVHHLPNKTLSRKLASVTSFFKYCQRHQFISKNPAQFLKRPKITQVGRTNILTFDEIKLILNFIETQIKVSQYRNKTFQYKIWKKRYAIFFTLFSVGMRVEELCKLKCADLELIENQLYRIHITAKGNKKHSPLIHPQTAAVLLDYISTLKKDSHDLIFKGMHRSSIYQMVKFCVQKVGIQKKISPHSLRASLATHLHQKCVPIGQIKDLLNHKSVATTLLYTNISDEELQNNATILNFCE